MKIKFHHKFWKFSHESFSFNVAENNMLYKILITLFNIEQVLSC